MCILYGTQTAPAYASIYPARLLPNATAMRIFLIFSILLCFGAGSWLLPGNDFFWPSRAGGGSGMWFADWSASLLGAALLLFAVLGVMMVRQAAGTALSSPRWQWAYWSLLALALTLLAAALLLAHAIPPAG